MKKSLAAVLVLVLVLALVACGGGTAQLGGTYMDEETGTVYLVFNGSEVSCTSPASGEPAEGSYKTENGAITFSFAGSTPFAGEPLPYTLEDNGARLIIDEVVYIRQNAAAPGGATSSNASGSGTAGGDDAASGGSGAGASGSGSAAANGDAGNSDELKGTFLEETGSVSLTFDGAGGLLLDFPNDGYSAEGTYEVADGILTFHFNEYTPMADRPLPYELNETGLVLDGTLYVRQ